MKRTTKLSALLLTLLAAAAVTTGCDNVALNDGNAPKEVETVPPRVTVALTTVDHSTTLAETEPPETEPEEEETQGEYELTTAKPKFDDYTYIGGNTIVLTGTCERTATLNVSGSIFTSFSTSAHEKRWFIAIDMKNNDSDTVTITAQVRGKNASTKLQVKIVNDQGSADCFIGQNSMLFYPATQPDYIGNNLWNDGQKNTIKKNMLKRLERPRTLPARTPRLSI